MTALYSLYRPHTFDEVVGQNYVVFTLVGALKKDSINHAYLFTGPRGSGKTTVARILAASVNCKSDSIACGKCESCLAIQNGSYQDVVEIDAASNRGINDIRNLKERINYMPVDGKYKVFIIDEAHQLTTEASNAFLKTLEEPPSHIIFILCTTEPQKIIPTIRSRCQIHQFHSVSDKIIQSHLKKVAGLENESLPDNTLELIAMQAKGSVRDALSLLDVVMGLEDRNIERVREILGKATFTIVGDFISCLCERDVKKSLTFIENLYGEQTTNLLVFREDVVAWLRGLMLITAGVKYSHPMLDRMQDQALDFKLRDLMVCMDAFTNKEDRYSPYVPQLILELPALNAIENMNPRQDF